jgi:metal-sulfur cluster biosynthetic enzyme
VISQAEVSAALSHVRDPELDQPLTELGFVSSIDVDGDTVEVHLRLPTYFCAQNFAYLMVSDAKAAILTVPGVADARVYLDDHIASSEVNEGVASGRGFEDAFCDDETDGDLDDLRDIFRRKGFVSRQENLSTALVRSGRTPESLTELRLGDLPPSPELDTYLDRRRELGLAVDPDAPFLVDPDGRPVPPETISDHLRFARMTRLSIEANAGLCRTLLEARYGLEPESESGVAVTVKT